MDKFPDNEMFFAGLCKRSNMHHIFETSCPDIASTNDVWFPERSVISISFCVCPQHRTLQRICVSTMKIYHNVSASLILQLLKSYNVFNITVPLDTHLTVRENSKRQLYLN